MRRILVRTTACLLLLGLLPLPAAIGQEVTQLRIDQVDIEDHPQVHFSANVPSHPDGPRPDAAFTVTENGDERRTEIRYVEDAGLQVVLLIDTTGSMGGGALAGAKAAATTFLEQVAEDTRIAVANYDTEATVLTGFDADRAEHAAAIDGLEAGGRTAMYDAVTTAIASFPEAGEATSRVVVLLTDGEDNASESTLDDAIDGLVTNDVTLHSVEYLTSSGDEAGIRDMALATNGEVREAADAAALTAVYEDLAANLVSRYTFSYTSGAGGAVDLVLEVEHDGLTAVGRETITLPKPPADTGEDASAAPVVTEPPTIPPAETSSFGRLSLVAGAVLWFVALAVMVAILLAPRTRKVRLSDAAARFGAGKRGMSEAANRASLLAERGLDRRGLRGGLNTALERAGILLRPGEFVVLAGSVAVTAFAVGLVLQGWLLALVLMVVAVAGARLSVSFLADRRQKRFAEQLGETLQLLSGSLRAGYSLMQAVDSVAREADSPAAEEFGRLVVETRLGRDLSDALRPMAERMQCDDFVWVMQAIEIHREVGGDLAEVLDTVAATIRERSQIRRQVQALSAEGKLSAYVLLALPFGVGFMLMLTNPTYLGELTNGGLLGWGLIGIGTLLMTVGVIWMRKLVKLVF